MAIPAGEVDEQIGGREDAAQLDREVSMCVFDPTVQRRVCHNSMMIRQDNPSSRWKTGRNNNVVIKNAPPWFPDSKSSRSSKAQKVET